MSACLPTTAGRIAKTGRRQGPGAKASGAAPVPHAAAASSFTGRHRGDVNLLRASSKSSRRPRLECRAVAKEGAAKISELMDRQGEGADMAGEDRSELLTLSNIRNSLIRQEDSIIFALIERSQFMRNVAVYSDNTVPVPGFDSDGRRFSLLEYMLRETEQLHGKVRRFTSPDEHAFFPSSLPPLVLPPIQFKALLAPCAASININPVILRLYLDELMPAITEEGDDNNYGSTVNADTTCLQALSKRIHYGKFVAEAKFLAQPEVYSDLIKNKDADGIMSALTDLKVEERVVARVRNKAATYGQDVSDEGVVEGGGDYKVEPDLVAQLYADWVMPLTKDVQVEYLLRRLDHVDS